MWVSAREAAGEGMEKGKTRWGLLGVGSLNMLSDEYILCILRQVFVSGCQCYVHFTVLLCAHCTFYLYILQIHTMYDTVNVLTTVCTTSCFVYSLHNALVTCYYASNQ